MARRPLWEGHLRLSLVTCPVALFSATTRARDVSFHFLHKKTHNRVHMIPHDPELGEVSRKDLVRGFEVRKNKYVIVTDEEIKKVRLPSTRTIDIERFVDAGDIDRIYWNDPYYLVPSGDAGTEAYAVIRDAMEHSQRVAIGRLVLHMRERMVALEPRAKGILLTTLRSNDEVVDSRPIFSDIPNKRFDKQMLEIAGKIIEQQEAEFDPKQFRDRYEEALRQLVQAKAKGHEPVEAPEPEKDNVIDLMEALKQSLHGRHGRAASRRAEAHPRSRSSKRPAARRQSKPHRKVAGHRR